MIVLMSPHFEGVIVNIGPPDPILDVGLLSPYLKFKF